MLNSFVLYRSYARRPLDQKTIAEILLTSLRNNSQEGLTGFLHTDEDNFLQYIEGPPGPLMRKVSQIQKDHRHIRFKILAEGETDGRVFPDWDMGQIDPELLPANEVLANKPWLHVKFNADPLSLIRAFADHAGQSQNVQIIPHS